MNLLLLDPAEIGPEGHVRLTDRRAEHLRRVLRVTAGRELRVGVVGGSIGLGRVVAVGDESVELALAVPDWPAPRPEVDLIVALPRPQALHRVLQYAAAFGVGTIDLTNAWRVEKSYFSSPALAQETIRRHLWLGAEQGISTWLPEVRIRPLLVPFVDQLRQRADPPLRLLAHPDAPQPIEAAFRDPAATTGRVEIAFGPEGGWIGREVETFSGAGFRPVRLGPWILRVETALAGALCQLALLRRLGRENVIESSPTGKPANRAGPEG